MSYLMLEKLFHCDIYCNIYCDIYSNIYLDICRNIYRDILLFSSNQLSLIVVTL